MKYDFLKTEKKWQEYWERHQTFRTDEHSGKPKIYILDMFPYPSGAGLHVGHPEGYTATDILSRYYRMKGLSVLHPMGWDAFGLPAERYAMQTNIHPRVTTEQNIDTFRRQIKMLGLSYDWSREINTTDPAYYKWTQWIFLKIYNSWYDPRADKARPIETLEQELVDRGTKDLTVRPGLTATEWRAMTRKQKHDFLAQFRLVYIAEIPVNWCEALGTVLANEEVAEWTEKGYTVERRPMRQWLMRITAYAQRLLHDAKDLDWPVSTLEQQRNWIGRSEGAEVEFQVKGRPERIRVFTTRPDTLFGATYMVLAPEHPLVSVVTGASERQAVDQYRSQAAHKSDFDRTIEKDKTGVFTGATVINPATRKEIPVWIADYVVMGYGTGAIMAVPGHDERDFEFARKFHLPIVKVVEGGQEEGQYFIGDGTAVNSANDGVSLDSLSTEEAKRRIIDWLQKNGTGKGAIQYKLRDWLFSRQRYWGEPIPIIHLEDGTMKPLDEKQLPLELPSLEKFQPSGTTESPLVLASSWVNVVDEETGLKGRRETNTMPQWAGSCWYYLRFIDPHNADDFCSLEKERQWMPIKLYVGGAEHTVLHLMYARFWHKVLYDLGYLSTKEPFMKLRHQGTILGEDSRKMSKSRGNVVNPDEVVSQYGSDSVRLFEMFMGPLEEVKPWSTKGVEGVFRFLGRVWRLYVDEEGNTDSSLQETEPTADFERLYHQTLKKVGEDIESLRFNTAISQMMIFVNEATKLEVKPIRILKEFILILAPFAPHISEEIWERLGHKETLSSQPWPVYDNAKVLESTIEVILQVNGKVRGKLTVPMGTDESKLEALALNDANVQRHINGKKVVKKIVVKNKLVNLVVPQ
ncbi:MAG: leucine--tRNA ligase [Bacteroidota bacterium]